jgi:NTP pyrophosphatase (non-canonical NTP hydrolase)
MGGEDLNPDVSARAVKLILEERAQQDAKWGDQAHHPDTTWLAILTEELGELSQVILHAKFSGHHGTWKNAIEEATQVAAVSMAWLEALITRYGRGEDL